MSREVLFNESFVPEEEARVSLVDRGFQFGESVYEVIRAYRGRPFEMDRHLRRFRASAEAIGLDLGPRLEGLAAKSVELLRRSALPDALIYLQATSGAAPRIHLRPEGLEPTVLVTVTPTPLAPDRWQREGISAITVPDDRWARCYVKTTMLLPNTTAKRRAVEAGCDDALFVRDGFLTEASAANVFAVVQGVVTTPPKSNYLLHGITREVVLEIAADLGIARAEGPLPAEKLCRAEELFLTGTAFEMLAITALDGKKIGSGTPGPLFDRLLSALQRRIEEL